MVDEHEDDVGALDDFGVWDKVEIAVALEVGFGDQQVTDLVVAQVVDDFERGRLAQVVDVGLEGEAEAADHWILEPGGGFHHPLQHPGGLMYVDFACGADEATYFGVAGNDEPRIDGDTVAADAGAGVEDVDARVTVGEGDDVPHADAFGFADHRELVGEGDVDVAEGVFDEFRHFGGTRIGGDDLAAHERLVELDRVLGGTLGNAADDAVVLDQLDQDPAGQHALGTVGDVDIGAGIEACLFEDRRDEFVGGADWAG